MTELSFLIDLLLNHKLPPATKKLIAERVKEVELSHSAPIIRSATQITNSNPALAGQAPSMQAIMARNPDLIVHKNNQSFAVSNPEVYAPAPAPVPVENVAQTPAAVAAVNSRAAAIAEAISGKVNKETGRPRKF